MEGRGAGKEGPPVISSIRVWPEPQDSPDQYLRPKGHPTHAWPVRSWPGFVLRCMLGPVGVYIVCESTSPTPFFPD